MINVLSYAIFKTLVQNAHASGYYELIGYSKAETNNRFYMQCCLFSSVGAFHYQGNAEAEQAEDMKKLFDMFATIKETFINCKENSIYYNKL